MSNGQRVVVVDDVSETDEVLRALFEPRGVQIDRLSSRAWPLSATNAADVVVVDTDGVGLRAPWDATDVPHVFIGTARLPALATDDGGSPQHYLCKPFEVAELIRTIEKFIR